MFSYINIVNRIYENALHGNSYVTHGFNIWNCHILDFHVGKNGDISYIKYNEMLRYLGIKTDTEIDTKAENIGFYTDYRLAVNSLNKAIKTIIPELPKPTKPDPIFDAIFDEVFNPKPPEKIDIAYDAIFNEIFK